MTRRLKSAQSGLSFIGLLFVVGLLACAGVVAAQIFPTVLEYRAVLKAVDKAKEGSTVVEIRQIFDKAAQIDDIHAIKGADLEIGKEGDKIVVAFAYTREIHLAGPGWLTLKYSGRSK